MSSFRRVFVARPPDEIESRLDPTIQQVVGKVTEELRELLLVDDGDTLRRNYPTAYPDDDVLESDFQSMVHDQLLMSRLDAIDLVQASLSADRFDLDTADAWMNTLNQVRLVLGDRLDVGEDDVEPDEDDPDAPSVMVYQLLSFLLDELTQARMQFL